MLTLPKIKFSSCLFDYYDLKWDSDYFGIPCAKVVLYDDISLEDIAKIKELSNDYEFVTIVNNNNRSVNNKIIGEKTTAFLADINLQFEKTIEHNNGEINIKSKIANEILPDDRLLYIAGKMSIQSRFFCDPYLDHEKAIGIYRHWVNSAFNKQNKYFLTLENENDIEGFILFGYNYEQQKTVIELISINPDYTGKGVGRKLINDLLLFESKSNSNIIKVGTQINNIHAVNFYIKCDFKFITSNSIYHYWPKR